MYLTFLARRLGQSILVVLGVVCITFLIVRVVPGDPAVAYAGPKATAQQLEQVREQLGLNDPMLVQLWNYLLGLLQGDLGQSLRTRRDVTVDLLQVVPASMQLTVAAILLALIIGVPLGIIAAKYRNKLADIAIRVISILSVSLPVFWVGLVLQLFFATHLGWLPTAGEYTSSLNQTSPLYTVIHVTIVDSLLTGNWPVFWSNLQHMIMPTLVIAAYPIGLIAQMTRASLADELQQPHVMHAVSAGLSQRQILTLYALKPALNPIVAVVALVFAYSIVNSFLVEAIFNWPGLGSYTFAAIRALDTPAVAGVTLVVAILYVFLNLLVDLVQAALDPRVRVA